MIVRFKRATWRGGNSRDQVPIWHIAVHPYRKGELYQRYVALCGYEIEVPYLTNAMLSHAVKPKGGHCKKCIAKQALRERESE
jgi:hypothetical protein